jgi:hypothetical protein
VALLLSHSMMELAFVSSVLQQDKLLCVVFDTAMVAA